MGRSRIKESSIKQGSKILAPEPINFDNNPIIFSLEKVQKGKYCFSNLDDEHKARFSDAIFKRKDMLWKEIRSADRHGLGTEKIHKSSLKTALPKFITEDFDEFLVFRYRGKNPMVGYRQRDVFYVLWFDHDFTLYSH